MSDTPKSFDDWWNSDPKDEAGIEYGLDEYHLLREGWRACIEHRAKPVERENADLRARLEAAERDAVRWNFVMGRYPYANALWQSLPHEIVSVERHLNNAIDAVMQEEK